MLCTNIVLNVKTKKKQFMYTTCSELVVFMYWTGKSLNNLMSYCGLVDARIRAFNKDLPVTLLFYGKSKLLKTVVLQIFDLSVENRLFGCMASAFLLQARRPRWWCHRCPLHRARTATLWSEFLNFSKNYEVFFSDIHQQKSDLNP